MVQILLVIKNNILRFEETSISMMWLQAYLNLSDLLVSFSGVPWVAPSSKFFLATRLPPAFTIDPVKKNSLMN